MNEVLVRRPVFPSDFRTLFRTLARCAVASSFGLAASCGSPSSSVPSHEPSAAGGAAVDGMLDAGSGGGGIGGSSGGGTSAGPDPVLSSDAAVVDAAIDAGPPLPGPWVELACVDELRFPLDQTHLPMPLDSLVLYTPFFLDGQAPPNGTLDFSERVVHGESCTVAGDQAVCPAVEQALAATQCPATPCAPFYLATAGEAVTRVEERAALSMLLGGVDTEVEAAIAALLADVSIMCWSTVERDGEVIDTYGTRIRAIEGGYEIDTQYSCYGARLRGAASVDANANVVIQQEPGICLGRRPEGLVAAAACAAHGELGEYFASSVRLEAASVFAFEQLARDLGRLGAPHELIELALRSALEEVGHARTTSALVERFGGECMMAQIAPPPERGALAVALENAVEGCVRETYGALVACYQAEAALDPHVRAAMAQIAEDETRHAQLAWRIAAWLEPQLSEAEQLAVQLARRAAYAELQHQLRPSLSRTARALIGLPDEPTALGLLAQLDTAIGLQA